MNEPRSRDYHDISATEFKKRFGKTLDDAAHGQPVRIIRHGRRDQRLVLLREDALAALQARVNSPLEALREQFDNMLARMQTPEARQAAASIGTVKPATLGEAAQRGTRRGG
ncbi:MAG: type II toxin-antitoxin system prevent-host-death family antitoxin [Wenzhouxiangellaceae bacterium]|nr:type II toxin-antitoxin system prevent-host-death family antitoxin [Wenzhouxiangellaceae bacterium]